MKVAYNTCFGGFGLSEKALELYGTKKGGVPPKYGWDIDRADPLLIEVIEELGKDADGFCAALAIVEIPDGAEWEIDEYDGIESIVPPRQSW